MNDLEQARRQGHIYRKNDLAHKPAQGWACTSHGGSLQPLAGAPRVLSAECCGLEVRA